MGLENDRRNGKTIKRIREPSERLSFFFLNLRIEDYSIIRYDDRMNTTLYAFVKTLTGQKNIILKRKIDTK